MKLQDMLIEASQKYYTSGDSTMTDAEFDSALAQLKKEDPTNPIITAVGHGYNIELDTTEGKKVKHKYGCAGSLPKCHNWKEYHDQLSAIHHVHASLKLDGMSVVMYFSSGHLTQALTRGGGDGSIGIDITRKVALIAPQYFDIADETFTGAVRGEIVMSYAEFEKFKEAKGTAKNPRNSAVGLINSKYSLDDDFKYLSIVVYTVIGEEGESKFSDYGSMHRWLAANFSDVVPYEIVDHILEYTISDEMKTLRAKWYGIYPADGIVLTASKIDTNGNELAYDAVAYKFNDEVGTSEVIDIDWNLSKTGYLVPRVHINTISLSGTDVSWIHGDNAKNIVDSRLGTGARVEVIKAGEIIPDIQKILAPGTVVLPTTCPACGRPLEWKGVHLACVNKICPNMQLQDLLIWSGTIAPQDNLGDTLKETFFSELNIASIRDVYDRGQLTVGSDSIQYSNFVTMYNRLFTEHVTLDTAIRALNVPRFGDVNSKKLAKYPELVIHLMNSFDPPSESYRAEVGDANFNALLEYSYKFESLQYIKDNVKWRPVETAELQPVVVTGKLSVKRSDFEHELFESGYKLTDTVNKKTFVLITDDPNSSTAKNKKADELGVPKLTESQFRSQYM